MVGDTDVPELTDNDSVNKQLLVYFWWLIVLSFAAQCINFVIQYLSGTIDSTVLGILCLGAVQTLLIGGGAKMVQKQMDAVSNKYNKAVKQNVEQSSTIITLQSENEDLKKQLVNRDAELISIKCKDVVPPKECNVKTG